MSSPEEVDRVARGEDGRDETSFGKRVLAAVAGEWDAEDLDRRGVGSAEPDRRFVSRLFLAVAGYWNALAGCDAYQGGAAPPPTASLGDLVSWLGGVPTRDRLDLRTHADDPGRFAGRRKRCGCVEVRRRIFESAGRQASSIARLLQEQRKDAGWEPVASAKAAVRELEDYLRSKQVFSAPLSGDLATLRVLVSRALDELSASAGPSYAIDSLGDLTWNLDRLDDVMNDYSGADLRGLFLPLLFGKLRLAGIRWTAEFRWPWLWTRRMRRASEEVVPGIFKVRSD